MYKIRKKVILFLSFLFVTNVSFANIVEYQIEKQEQQQNNFVAGQVWSYKTRVNEQDSKLTILKVDYFESAIVVHIRLENVKLVDPDALHGIRTTVPHMAILQTALQKSVIHLLSDNKRLPEFSKEYQLWREGDGIGTAWAWHFTVSVALNGLERSNVNKQQSAIEKIKDTNN